MKKAILSVLLLSAVCASPASANYFSNPRLGVNLNIGSAPNPTPMQLRLLNESTQTTIAENVVPAAPAYVPPPPAPPAAPPPAAYEPPPAAAAPAEIPRQFMVFFDFDRSTLSPDARTIIAKAVDTARRTGSVNIVVTGHTDTVGSLRYNQALSERRAAAVKREMIRDGFNGTMIATVGRNFSDPLISTGPGVREPQNRRSVIDLGTPPIATLEMD